MNLLYSIRNIHYFLLFSIFYSVSLESAAYEKNRKPKRKLSTSITRTDVPSASKALCPVREELSPATSFAPKAFSPVRAADLSLVKPFSLPSQEKSAPLSGEASLERQLAQLALTQDDVSAVVQEPLFERSSPVLGTPPPLSPTVVSEDDSAGQEPMVLPKFTRSLELDDESQGSYVSPQVSQGKIKHFSFD